jgi:hypothetical protein
MRAAMLVSALLLFAPLLAAALPASSGPLAKEEKDKLAGPICKPFMAALMSAAQKSAATKGTNQEKMAAAMKEMQRPAEMSEADYGACQSLFLRELRTYQQRAVESEATATLAGLATGMKSKWEQDKTLCPSSKKPVPADLKVLSSGSYITKDGDWSDPAWACIAWGGTGERQRFQYEIKTDAKKRTFELVARGYPGGDGKLVTFTRAGKIVGDAVEVGPIQRKP